MKKQIAFITVLGIVLLSACASAGGGSSGLTGIEWQWTAMQETAPAHQSVVPDPGNYTIVFNADGTVNVKADCNNAGGSYTVNGSNLTINVGPSTLAYCGEASEDTIYLASLAKVSSYAIENGSLQLIFADDGGKMDFQNGGAAQ
jgi:heat shock protein HslJ